MLDLFTSVGARSFVVTKTDIEQALIWGKTYSAMELHDKLPATVRTAADRKPHRLPTGETVMASQNLIIRPTGTEVAFVQLDDLAAEQLDRIRPAAFIINATSSGSHQAWIAVSGVTKTESKDFIRRVRKAVGHADASASAGTFNFKEKYLPEPPVVTIIHAAPGRVMTLERLQGMGLLVEAEPVKIPVAPARVSGNHVRPWPSYEISLMRAPRKPDGTPDRSKADFGYVLTCLTGGKPVEDTIAKLMEVSECPAARGAWRHRICANYRGECIGGSREELGKE